MNGRSATARNLGLVAAVTGVLAPWAMVAGHSLSGFATVELYLTLAGDGLPSSLRALAWLWYLSVLGGLAAWCMLSLSTRRRARAAAALIATCSGVGMALFAFWSAADAGVSLLPPGPLLTLLGLVAIAASAYLDPLQSRRHDP